MSVTQSTQVTHRETWLKGVHAAAGDEAVGGRGATQVGCPDVFGPIRIGLRLQGFCVTDLWLHSQDAVNSPTWYTAHGPHHSQYSTYNALHSTNYTLQ